MMRVSKKTSQLLEKLQVAADGYYRTLHELLVDENVLRAPATGVQRELCEWTAFSLDAHRELMKAVLRYGEEKHKVVPLARVK